MNAPRITIGLGAMLITACVSPQGKGQVMREDDALIFEKFKTLAGTFLEVEGEGEPARIEYRLISRGTVLTETWIMPAGQYGPNGKEELTVFHMDNGALIATHYCAAGIHPTMVLNPESPPGKYNFVPRSISNLSSHNESHNSGFGYTFEDEDTVYRSEQWTIKGEKSLSYLRMARVKE
ncbi:MAG: hypothetical protein AAGB02_06225 [Pseudomonadota bacterium]